MYIVLSGAICQDQKEIFLKKTEYIVYIVRNDVDQEFMSHWFHISVVLSSVTVAIQILLNALFYLVDCWKECLSRVHDVLVFFFLQYLVQT